MHTQNVEDKIIPILIFLFRFLAYGNVSADTSTTCSSGQITISPDYRVQTYFLYKDFIPGSATNNLVATFYNVTEKKSVSFPGRNGSYSLVTWYNGVMTSYPPGARFNFVVSCGGKIVDISSYTCVQS